MSEPEFVESPRYRQALVRIDDYNRQDPHGREYPASLAAVAWIEQLRPNASEALRLAGRAHHVGRWRVPRDSYPRDRAGYLRWREDLQAFHADEAAAILADCGYSGDVVARVRAIVSKENLKDDPEAQTFEDALCLVFMERQLADFIEQHDEKKLRRILKRTWAKMSPQGREAALALPLPAPARELLARALAP